MNNYEALWTFQTEDIKADQIANEIMRSPTRQRLEKSRDFIVEKQKEYKELEETISAMADRKDILVHAVEREEAQLSSLQNTYETNPPQDQESLHELIRSVSQCRDTLRQYEAEIAHIVSDTNANDKKLRSVWLETAKAKHNFDQLKVDYNNESRAKKEELEQQKNRVAALQASVDPDLLERYQVIKKHISPPVARLIHGQCAGCNTSLPSATLSKIKNGSLVECETCGRLIIQ